jgi:hypothetical protein
VAVDDSVTDISTDCDVIVWSLTESSVKSALMSEVVVSLWGSWRVSSPLPFAMAEAEKGS